MLILCSNGLSSDALLYEAARRVRGETAALVVTADNEYKHNNYHVPRCTAELNSLGFKVELFDIDASPCERLLDYDAVEFIGGNPFYLLDSLRKNNAFDSLLKISKEKTLIGWSAAAFVFGPSLELVKLYSPQLNFMGLTELDGLALTEISVLPHYSRFLERIEGFEAVCSQYEQKTGVSVLRLNDGDGVFIDEAHSTLIRGR